MPKKKGQAIKGGFASAKNIDDALDIARYGELAKSPVFLVALTVWRFGFPGRKLPPELAKMEQDSEREWEEKLGAIVVKALKEEDEKTLMDLVLTLQHCKAHSKGDGGLRTHDRIRTLALAYYERRTIGTQRTQRPVTSKEIRDYLSKELGKEEAVDQRFIYRMFKEELRIRLPKAKRAKAKRISGQ